MELWARLIAGSTLAAAKAILQGSKYAINWCGGWHHAQRYDYSFRICYLRG